MSKNFLKEYHSTVIKTAGEHTKKSNTKMRKNVTLSVIDKTGTIGECAIRLESEYFPF